MVKVKTAPCGTPSCAVISGAGLCVGPRMKFPSEVAGALAASGKPFAVTYPGVLGSRVGGVGRTGRATAAGGAWAIAGSKPVIKVIKHGMLRRRNISISFLEPLPILTRQRRRMADAGHRLMLGKRDMALASV